MASTGMVRVTIASPEKTLFIGWVQTATTPKGEPYVVDTLIRATTQLLAQGLTNQLIFSQDRPITLTLEAK